MGLWREKNSLQKDEIGVIGGSGKHCCEYTIAGISETMEQYGGQQYPRSGKKPGGNQARQERQDGYYLTIDNDMGGGKAGGRYADT